MIFAATSLAWAQDPKVAFEVATVKINTDANAGAYFSGGPGSNDPTQFTGVRLRFGTLVRLAFNINSSYQYSMPSGLPDTLYDIHGKIPPGTDQAHYQQMMQNLLIERFGMRFHRETRDIAGYELAVAKSGSKLRTAEQAATPPDPDIPVGRIAPIKDRDGEPQLPPGRNAHIVFRLSDGRFRHSGRVQTIADIRAICERELGKPVTDRSGLTGVYDFNIDFMRRPDDPAEKLDEDATPFLTALQAQLGLRLESKKVPVDVIVIDHINKTPTEN